MFGQIKKMASALKAPSLRDRQIAYLNEASDRFDLEYRERQLDRGTFGRRGY
jgi:hypothetical protein